MKKILTIFAIMSLFACQQQKFEYPQTRKVDTVDTYFGVQVSDPYRWLENDTSAETAEWVKAQNVVTFDYLTKIPFREDIKNRLTEIWNYERYSTPFKQNNWYFYYKNDGLQNQSILYVQDKLDGEARVLLNPNTLSEDGTVALGDISVSNDGKYLAYTISVAGSDWEEAFVKEIATGKELSDHLKWIKFSGMSWYKDGFYYSRYDEPKRGEELTTKNEFHKMYYHKLNTDQSKDVLVFEDKTKPTYNFSGDVTDDEKYLILYTTETTHGNSLAFKDLTKPNAPFIKLVEGFVDSYSVLDHTDGKFIVQTNFKAPKYRLLSIEVNNYKPENWKDIIPEKENVLQACDIADGKIVAQYMKDAHSKVEVYDLTGKYLYDIELPTIGTMGGFNCEKTDKTAFYSFTSFTYPSVAFTYDFATNKSEIYRKPNIKFNFDGYETKQVFYTSKDGTKVPMFIVHKAGVKLDGSNPTLLYGYGGFNISLTPSFSVGRLAFLESGGVYAMANLRGGGEYGEEWHKAGTKLQKQNVFDDFIAAAEYLIAEKYTSPKKLACMGGSNGGLLVGAVINQRPDLFAVAIPQVGVLDMLRYQKFTIGRAWVGDYGSSDNEEEFKYILKYSPIQNIKESIDYPAVMVTTGDHDDRVVPAHSFKYIATLQEKYKGKNPVMVRIETNAGHGAGKPTTKVIEEAADTWAFILYNLGVTPELKK